MYSTLSQILSNERHGLMIQLNFDTYDEHKLASDAIVAHLHALEAGSIVVEPCPLQLLLPGLCVVAEGTGSSVEAGMRSVQRNLDQHAITKFNHLATRHKVTLNSILLGTLAMHLHALSGQDHFAINQTYLGRRPDQLRAVGSYSTFVAMEFSFDGDSCLASTCEHVFKETMRNMAAAPHKLAMLTSSLANVSYELNDVRPIPRPSSSPQPDNRPMAPMGVVLCDLFFLVNEHIDGFTAVVAYDVSKFEHAYAEVLLDGWLQMLCELEGLQSSC